jgi:E3 ubiquitin-protein ligase HUWE1
MFGGRRPVPAGLAQHPLITPPTSAPAPAARRLPRGLSTVNGIQELISSLEGNASQEALRLLEQLIAQTRNTGGEAFRVDLAQDAEGAIALTLGGRSFHIPPPPAPAAADQDVTFEFVPKPTNQRWLEEMAIVPGGYSNTYTTRLVTHIVNRLMPEAKRLAEDEAQKQRKADEEEAERRRKEDEEREAAEKQKREEELESAAAIALPESRVSPPPPEVPDASGDVEMAPEPEAAPVESLARTIISIHGRDVDITDTGIDLEFLQALPDDMRADVVEQYMREHNRDRRPAADIPEPSSEISREFLDALPPEIRAEVLMQEALESARRSAPEAEGDLGPMGEAFPDLAGELQAIGSGMAAIANLLGGPQTDARGAGGGLARITGALGGSSTAVAKRSHREAIQLLDKNGIACLVRLLFFPEVFKRGYLFRVLVNLCENTNTRSDLLNLLLSVVQEGSGDLPAVDRSFQQMSLRAMSTPKVTPKTPKVSETPGPSSAAPLFAHLQSEHIPTFIAQRCFEALAYIVSSNQHAVVFFLTEHEQAVGLKKILSKKDKGKGKEKVIPQTKFPIVILLGLLDRPVLLKASSLMESLTGLLATITKPLSGLKKLEEANRVEAEAPPSEATEAPAAATPAQATTTVATLTGDGVPAAPHVSPPTTITKPPVIPHSVTRLVVNCLTEGECTSKTFSQTLALMQNLSHIPDTKEIILWELQTRSQELGKTIQQELAELAAALREEGEIDAATLAKFSPQTSSQSQLLRLLKTIDYLHISKVDSEPGEELTDQEKIVDQIFEALDFGPMWRRLSECLSIVEAAGDTDQIATVLLPLVEALMVMCKYRSRASREGSLPPVTPLAEFPPSADLFVSFTTAHRKVLNTIVRKNAALLSGSFSLLVRNSRVLEFDNKRAWFQLKLKRKRDQAVPVLHLNIRRQYVFEDSFHALQRKSGNEIKYGKLSVKFYNEDGIDAGGVTREWYSVLAQQIFDPNFGKHSEA